MTSALSHPALSPLEHLRHPRRGIVLALACTLLPTAAIAASPPALRISTAPAIDDASLFPHWLEERHPGLDDALLLPGHTQWIEIRIDGSTYDYQTSVTPVRDGEPLAPSSAFTCECNSEALLGLLDDEITDAVARLRATPVTPPMEPVSPSPTPPTPTILAPPHPAPAPPCASAPPSPVARAFRLDVAGPSVLVLGLLATGAGASLLVADDRPISGHAALYRELDPPGYVMLSAGLVALGSGIAMVILDKMRHEPRATRLGSPRPHRGTARLRDLAGVLVLPFLPGRHG